MKQAVVNRKWCKQCGLCIAYCPKTVLIKEDGFPVMSDAAACIGCKRCETICPDFAISIEEVDS